MSDHRAVQIPGPDNAELLVEPYPNGYVWKIRNGSLHAIQQPGLEIVSTQSFDAKRLAFRERIAARIGWTSRRLRAGDITKSTILVRVEGDHLELGESVGMNELSWPNGDPAVDRRWLLTIKVVGLSQEWFIELDLWWGHRTKTLLLADYSRVTAAEPHLTPFNGNDSRNAQWSTFLYCAQRRLSLCVQDDIPDPPWITRRFDTVADEALELFYKDPEDIESWPQTIDALYYCALGVMGTNATDLERKEVREHRDQWLKVAKVRAYTASIPEHKWNIGCTDKGVLKELRERFERLAAHAAETELKTKFEHRFQAVDAWLDLLRKESRDATKWKIGHVIVVSAEYCAELKIRALKAGESAKAEILSEIECQFRILASENSGVNLYAVHRGIEDDPPDTQPALTCSQQSPPSIPESLNAEKPPQESQAINELSRRVREITARTKQQILKAAITRQSRKSNVDTGRKQATRGKVRSAWLDEKCSIKGWTSDVEIAQNGGPTYNTTHRYRSGRKSTRDGYVRGRLAKAFGCKVSEVPE